MEPPPFSFDSPAALWTGVAIAAAAGLVTLYRRPALPGLTKALGAISLVLMALAAGGPAWRGRGDVREEVVVMVDLSPSTRTATYRDPAVLSQRVRQLLGNTPHRVAYFADGDATPPDGTYRLPDIPAKRTAFRPPAAAAVILFSDGRFDPRAVAPPTHVVIDPTLEEASDAAVERLEVRDGELAVTVRNDGGPRELTVAAPADAAPMQATVSTGGAVLTRRLPEAAQSVAARLAAADAWPENDQLTLTVPPPADLERWWVGGRGGEGWRDLPPSDIPSDAAAYLRPAVIVVDNVAAAELSDLQQQRLRQYVHDLGGGLVVLGGDSAFAAGGYAGTTLDALSPLASNPPQPATHWVFLVDSSGSMNAPAAGGVTRWRAAAEAAARAVAAVPPHDLVSVAGFAAGLEWWVRAKPAADASREALPPAGARASGPTELRRALETVATGAPGGPPVELVVLTDANAPVEDPAALATLMTRNTVRLHLLDIGDSSGAGLEALRRVAAATGGTLLRESDPAAWAGAVRRLTRTAAPQHLVQTPARVEFAGGMEGLLARAVAPPWNRTWLRPQATAVGTGTAEAGPLAAVWNVGAGRVAAAGFRASPEEAEALARLAQRAPRDPRIRVTWETGSKLRVFVDAAESGAGSGAATIMNGMKLVLEMRDAAATAGGGGAATTVPQVGPGRYEVSVDTPAAPAVATLRSEGRIIDRLAVAGRYAPEFDRIGNDRRAMRALADSTGGSVVEPSVTSLIQLPRSQRSVPLPSPLAATAAACMAAALVRWRAR